MFLSNFLAFKTRNKLHQRYPSHCLQNKTQVIKTHAFIHMSSNIIVDRNRARLGHQYNHQHKRWKTIAPECENSNHQLTQSIVMMFVVVTGCDDTGTYIPNSDCCFCATLCDTEIDQADDDARDIFGWSWTSTTNPVLLCACSIYLDCVTVDCTQRAAYQRVANNS